MTKILGILSIITLAAGCGYKVDAACSDGVRNGNETDIDCGGSCGTCGIGYGCVTAADCDTGVCKDGECVERAVEPDSGNQPDLGNSPDLTTKPDLTPAATCDDKVKNGNETDIDCGGGCTKCTAQKSCAKDADCWGECRFGKCLNIGAQPCGDKSDCIPELACIKGLCEQPAPRCDDKVKNGTETDVDCGGNCPKCDLNKACAKDSDCLGACVNGVCKSMKNQACGNNGDCASPLICTNNVCVDAPSCKDGIKNADETDVDCGGIICQTCWPLRNCLKNSDCTGVCVGGVCRATQGQRCPTFVECAADLVCVDRICAPVPTCNDGKQNGDETDVDCGGSCVGCDTNQRCRQNNDCWDNVCMVGFCQQHRCNDGTENGFESDVDCGGHECGGCVDGKICGNNADCRSGSCLNMRCAPSATCDDGKQNGNETGVDCGGPVCKVCNGGACLVDADCQRSSCIQWVCQRALILTIDRKAPQLVALCPNGTLTPAAFDQVGNRINRDSVDASMKIAVGGWQPGRVVEVTVACNGAPLWLPRIDQTARQLGFTLVSLDNVDLTNQVRVRPDPNDQTCDSKGVNDPGCSWKVGVTL